MGALTAHELQRRFNRQIEATDGMVEEALKLRRQGRLSVRSTDALCESGLVNAYARFETYLEELFYTILLGTSGIPGVRGTITVSDRRQAESILQGSKTYLEWLPLTKAMTTADLLLADGQPFSRLKLRGEDLKVMNDVRIVRNAVAHDSASSNGELRKVADRLGFSGRRRTAASVLKNDTQGQTRCNVFLLEMASIAEALAEPMDADADLLLHDADLVQKKQIAPKGKYRCTTCSGAVEAKVPRPLGECRNCRRAGRRFKTWELTF